MSLQDLTLKLFNVVPSNSSVASPQEALIDFNNGVVVSQDARWAESSIRSFLNKKRLSGEDLNKTYHATWEEVTKGNDFDRIVESIMGFINGLGKKMKDEVVIPSDIVTTTDTLKFKVIESMPEEDINAMVIGMLESGIALKSETISDLVKILQHTEYKFTGNERIRNKEASIVIADKFGHYPTDPVETLRYVVYKATDSTLLIKSKGAIAKIENSEFDPCDAFTYAGLERMAEVFNRFKPLFLAFKRSADGKRNRVINRIAKLSKTNHKPLPVNALSTATSQLINDRDMHWLENATTFALIKALNACHVRLQGQDIFAFHIRNGKAWYKEAETSVDSSVLQKNFDRILGVIRNRLDFSDKKVYIPPNVEYGLPTSEKMFIGNVPTFTKFTGDKLAAGVYWKNSWGARDLDVSAVDIHGGKIGWNTYYSGQSENILYSGDITSAPSGAVEYIHVKEGLYDPILLLNNVYSGDDNCDYKIVIGQGEDMSRSIMMDPKKVWVEEMTESVKRETLLGVFLPGEGKTVSFVMLNTATGSHNASTGTEHTIKFNKAFSQYCENVLSLNDLLVYLGADLTDEIDDATIDLSLNALDRNTFIDLLN